MENLADIQDIRRLEIRIENLEKSLYKTDVDVALLKAYWKITAAALSILAGGMVIILVNVAIKFWAP